MSKYLRLNGVKLRRKIVLVESIMQQNTPGGV